LEHIQVRGLQLRDICRVQNIEDKPAMVVLDTFMDRVRESDLIRNW